MEILVEVQRTSKNFFIKDVKVGIWSLYHTYNAMFEERNLKKDHALGFSSYSWWSVIISDKQFSNKEETLGFDIRGENASDQGTRINGFKWFFFSALLYRSWPLLSPSKWEGKGRIPSILSSRRCLWYMRIYILNQESLYSGTKDNIHIFVFSLYTSQWMQLYFLVTDYAAQL